MVFTDWSRAGDELETARYFWLRGMVCGIAAGAFIWLAVKKFKEAVDKTSKKIKEKEQKNG